MGPGASRWVSSTLLLRLVQQDRLPAPSASLSDSLDGLDVTLAQLLSGTAGLLHDGARGPCQGDNMQACVEDILDVGAAVANSSLPTNGAAGLALAAWVAERATDQAWGSLFDDFRAECGMGPEAKYALWSANNPWPAGGLKATPQGYASFLQSLINGSLLEPVVRELQWQDWAEGASEQAQLAGLGEWHSGLGVVLECDQARWNQTQCSGDRVKVSGAGRLGFYPFISFTPRLHYGLIARPSEVNMFNSTHALAMTIVGAVCLVLGVVGVVLAYCTMKKKGKEEKKHQAAKSHMKEAGAEVELATEKASSANKRPANEEECKSYFASADVLPKANAQKEKGLEV